MVIYINNHASYILEHATTMLLVLPYNKYSTMSYIHVIVNIIDSGSLYIREIRDSSLNKPEVIEFLRSILTRLPENDRYIDYAICIDISIGVHNILWDIQFDDYSTSDQFSVSATSQLKYDNKSMYSRSTIRSYNQFVSFVTMFVNLICMKIGSF